MDEKVETTGHFELPDKAKEGDRVHISNTGPGPLVITVADPE